MSLSIGEQHRNIFPRWRDFTSTVRLKELDTPKRNSLRKIDFGRAMEVRKAEWSLNPSLWTSLDLIGTAVVTGDFRGADEALAVVLGDENTPDIAKSYLTQTSNISFVDQGGEIPLTIADQAKEQIRQSRKKLSHDPSDAIEWVELALGYTVSGLNEKAERAIRIALSLTPDSRYVLRSSARFFIHVGDLDSAHGILTRSDRVNNDPWLLASEIAVASAAGRRSRFVKRGRTLLAEDYSNSDLSELASALGTLETEHGNERIARKLLRQSLVDANENSIAQINHLNRAHLGDGIDTSRANPPLLHEARAWTYSYQANWQLAKEESLRWLADQPFASAPAVLSSFILSDVLCEFETAESILQAAIRSNPQELLLLNNLAFCLLNQGKVEQGEAALHRIRQEDLNKLGPVKATFGLLEFRRGNFAEGRRLYRECIEESKKDNNRLQAARAAAHLALEEVLAGTDQIASALNSLHEFEQESKMSEVVCTMDRIMRAL